jgi:hypothetical protein
LCTVLIKRLFQCVYSSYSHSFLHSGSTYTCHILSLCVWYRRYTRYTLFLSLPYHDVLVKYFGSCACSGWPHLQLTQLNYVQSVENFHLYKHFCICQHVASVSFYLKHIIKEHLEEILLYTWSSRKSFIYIIYPWNKSSSDNLKWWLDTAGIKAGASRVK